MVPALSTKNVKIPVYFEEQFQKLTNRDAWGPGGFPSFVREAVRWFLIEQERLSRYGISSAQEEEGRTDREPRQNKVAHRNRT